MSLKAKIEAVIYAAEEPVTLAQLASLFGVEAEAEIARRDAAQGRLALGVVQRTGTTASALDEELNDFDANDPEALNAEVIDAVDEAEVEAADLDAPDPDGPEMPVGTSTADADPAGPAERESVSDAPADAASASASVGSPEGAEVGAAPEAGDAAADLDDVAATDADGVRRRREERDRARRVRDLLRSLLDDLMRDYATSDRGLEIREIAGGFRLATKPEYHDAVRGFARTLKPPLKLSLQALETLAVVAYKQPVTAPEVSEIRGVDSGGVLGSLMGRKLVATAGRKQVIGRPILYRTTKDFLLRFGLKDISELPSIEEFEKMAGELAQEEMSMTDESSTFPGGVESPGVTEPGEDQVGTRDGGGSVDSPPGVNPSTEGDVTIPQADGDAGESVPVEDTVPLDGRTAGLDPPDLEPGGDQSQDSPALDAQIQSDEGSGS